MTANHNHLRADLADVLNTSAEQVAELRAQLSLTRQRLEEARGLLTKACADVVAERERQRSKLGWTEAHDDKHTDGFLAILGAAKALCATNNGHFELRRGLSSYFDAYGLVHERIYNGTFRDLLKEAGALIIAEIERIDRRSPPNGGQ